MSPLETAVRRAERRSAAAFALLEVLVVLVVLMLLYGAFFGVRVSLAEIALWTGGGLVLALVVSHFLVRAATGGWFGSGGGRRLSRTTSEGLAALRGGDLDAAERLLRSSVERDRADAKAALGLARIAFRRGEWERYLEITSALLDRSDFLRAGERVALCHRQADVALERLGDKRRAVEALARIETDYPRTADALRARSRIERILAGSAQGAQGKTD